MLCRGVAWDPNIKTLELFPQLVSLQQFVMASYLINFTHSCLLVLAAYFLLKEHYIGITCLYSLLQICVVLSLRTKIVLLFNKVCPVESVFSLLLDCSPI